MKKLIALFCVLVLFSGMSVVSYPRRNPEYKYNGIKFYTPVELTTNTNDGNIRLAKLSLNKFICAYRNGSAGYAVVVTMNGTSLTLGTPSEFDADILDVSPFDNPFGLGVLNSTKFVVAYTDDGLDNDGYTRIGTVSGTEISWGDAVEFDNVDAESIDLCVLTDSLYVIGYNDETNSDTATCVACTVSGTVPSPGTPNDVEATDWKPLMTNLERLSDTHFLMSWCATDDSYDGHMVCASVSGTTITFGTSVEFKSGDGFWGELSTINENAFIVSYQSGARTYAKAGTVSGTTITLGSEATLSAAGEGNIPATYIINDTLAVATTVKKEGAAYDKAWLIDCNFATRTLSSVRNETEINTSLTLGEEQNVNPIINMNGSRFVMGYVSSEGSQVSYIVVMDAG